MQLLYATKNNSKIYNMKRRLKGMPIELLTPNDINIKISVDENGKIPSENALKKAKAYYEKTKIATIAADSGLYISDLPKNKQPGLYVRRVNGKELTDDEMINYYSNLMKTIGGSGDAYYLTGLALVTEYGSFTIDIEEDHFILTEKRDAKHNHRGNPLDVIAIDPSCKKYYSEMTDEDFKNMGYKFETECLDFIQKNFIDYKYDIITSLIKQNRPSPLRQYDQIFMKEDSMIFQAKKFYHYLSNKNVAFLGDGDGASIMYGLLLANGIADNVKKITLLDFDERILNYHKKIYVDNKLNNFYNFETINYNVINPVPEKLLKQFDMFYINPPYGSKNNGNSCIAWLERCIDLCKDNCLGCIIIPYSDDYPWTKKAMLNIQEYLIKNGFIIREQYLNIHSYYLDVNLKSSTMIVEKIKKSQNQYSGQKLPNKFIDNLYGDKQKIPSAIIDDNTEYGKITFD